MSFDHRGFRVSVDVAADEFGVQWVCRAAIERIDGDSTKGAPSGGELTIPRAKIDPLMAISTLEQRAVTLIDDFYERGNAVA